MEVASVTLADAFDGLLPQAASAAARISAKVPVRRIASPSPAVSQDERRRPRGSTGGCGADAFGQQAAGAVEHAVLHRPWLPAQQLLGLGGGVIAHLADAGRHPGDLLVEQA